VACALSARKANIAMAPTRIYIGAPTCLHPRYSWRHSLCKLEKTCLNWIARNAGIVVVNAINKLHIDSPIWRDSNSS
jgi:hypothetical protein